MYIIPNYEIIETSRGKVIVNLLNGCADIIDDTIADNLRKGKIEDLFEEHRKLLLEREYIFENKENYIQMIKELDEKLIQNSKKEPPNFVYVPTYSCNLNCYYCFEKGYEHSAINEECDVEKFQEFCEQTIEKLQIKNDVKYKNDEILVTITGGEPLLITNYYKIEKILAWCKQKRFKVNIVTNGTTLDKYIDLFRKYKVDEIQVTLDGGRDIHDKIRITHSGEPTFDAIIKNIIATKKFIDRLTVRINVNKKNIYSIKDLTKVIKENPEVSFYTYLMQQEGCSKENNIIDEVEGIEILSDIQEDAGVVDNLNIVYHGKMLIDSIFSNKPFKPKIKICSAMQNQFIVDYAGNIYKCWWGIGNLSYAVGKINGEYYIDDNHVMLYKERRVNNIPKCRECKYRYICGGGCTGRLMRKQLENI